MRISTTIVLCLLSLSINAQLAGEYTIGGSNPDYTTLQEAVTDLGTQGVSASVNMLVRDGIYEEAFQIPSISGTGGDVWVTFKSESGTAENVIWQSALPAAEYYHWELMGVNNLRLEGITFKDLATDQSYYTCWGSETSNDGLQFIDCRFLSEDSVNSSHTYFWQSTGDVLVEDCYFGPADEGIYVTGGGSELHIIGCTFESWDVMLEFESFQLVILEGNHFNASGPNPVDAIDSDGFLDSVVIRENTFSGNIDDLADFYDGSNSIIFDKNLFETTEGSIGMEYCQNFTFTENRMTEGTGYGLQAEYCGTILFIDNEISEVEFYENQGDILFQNNRVIATEEFDSGLDLSSDNEPFIGEVKVLRNVFIGNGSSTGIELSEFNFLDNQSVEISNNSLQNLSRPMDISYVNRVVMSYNSISASYNTSNGILEVNDVIEMEFSNNIVGSLFDDSSDCWDTDTLDFIDAHHNVYFWPESNTGVFHNGQGDEIATFSDAQALGLEMNSVFLDPQFYNDSLDLRICNGELQGIGQQVPGITDDYFGQTRPTLPTPGFYEYNGLSAGFTFTQDQSLVSFEMIIGASAEEILWDFGDGTFSSAVDPTHYYTSTGPFTVTLTVSNPCETEQVSTEVVVVGSVGLEEDERSTWMLYPNPSKGMVHLRSPKDMETVSVYDMTGRMVYIEQPNKGLQELTLDLRGLIKGVYFLGLRNQDGTQTALKKLILH